MPQAANVTKFNAGGSGDNIIADGMIKTVEKIWMDTYDLSSHVSTKTTIDIAVLEAGKKLTGIDVIIETAVSQTSASIALGFSTDGAYGVIMGQTDITNALTVSVISLFGGLRNNLVDAFGIPKASAFQKAITGTQTTVTLQLNNFTQTSGTVKSIVRYT